MTGFVSFYLLFLYLFEICAEHSQSDSLCHLTSCPQIKLSNASVVARYCEQAANRTEVGRCCISSVDHDIIGLDLSNCDVSTLDIFQQKSSGQETGTFRSLKLLVLDQNPLEQCNDEGFDGMSSLEELFLPGNCSCPGGSDGWNATFSNNSVTHCLGMMDLCIPSIDYTHNVSCPANSHCTMGSPGHTLCLCDAGWSGYKCLREGTFPYVPYIVGLTAATILVSLGLWFTLRKNVKKID